MLSSAIHPATHHLQRIEHYRRKWLYLAPLGLILVGFGLCLFGNALFTDQKAVGFAVWFGKGTLSLITINAGLVLIAESVKNRVLYELTKHHQNPTAPLPDGELLSTDEELPPRG